VFDCGRQRGSAWRAADMGANWRFDMSNSHFARQAWLLVLAFITVNSLVVFGGRSRVPMAPTLGTMGLASQLPYRYDGPVPNNSIEIDMGGAFNASYVYDTYLGKSLRAGTIPLWDPYLGFGHPQLGNGLSGVLYPLNWLHAALPAPYRDAVYLLNWLLGGLFLYLYLQRLGVSARDAALGATALFCSGWFQGWLALREITGVAAWFPLLLYAIERVAGHPGWRYAPLVLATGVYFTITAGHPEAFIVSLLTAMVYGFARVLVLPRGKTAALGTLAFGAAAGLLLAAPMWVSFIDAVSYSINPHHDYASAAGLVAVPGHAYAAYWLPNVFGIMHDPDTAMLRAGLVESCNALCSEIEAPGWLPPVLGFLAVAGLWSLRSGIRRVVVFFAAAYALIAAKIWGVPGIQLIGRLPILDEINWPRYGAFVLIVAVAVVAVHGARRLVTVPVREWRAPIAMWLACVVALALVALSTIVGTGSGLSDAARDRSLVFLALGTAWAMLPPLMMWLAHARSDGALRVPFIAVLGMVFPAIAYGTGGFTAPQYVLLSAVYLAVFVAASTIATFAPRFTARAGAVLLVVCGSVPINASAALLRSGLPSRYDALALPPYLVKLKALQEGGLYRSFSFDAVPMPNVQTAVGIPGMGWIVPLVPEPSRLFFKQFLDRTIRMPNWYAGNVTAWPDAVPHGALTELHYNLRFFSLSAVRYVAVQNTALGAAGTGLQKELTPVYHDASSGVTLFENRAALPRIFLAPRVRIAATQDEVWRALPRIASLRHEVLAETGTPMEAILPDHESAGDVLSFDVDPNEVRSEYRARVPGMLVLTDLMVPGWRASIDGAEVPLYRVDGVFRGVRLERAGTYRVRFWYRPRYWTIALLLAVAGAAAAGLACLLRWPVARATQRRDQSVSNGGGA
jgi:hypothetical protein